MPTSSADANLLKIVTLVRLAPECVAALATSGFGPFATHMCESRVEAVRHLAEAGGDALILADDGSEAARDAAAEVARDVAILVVVARLEAAIVLDWLHRGAQDVLLQADLATPSLPLRLRAAIERKRREHDARTAYSTDVETGLPHQQQLIEHMSQLIALREREPAPMALLAVRIEGFATTEARLGAEAASVLRRKVAVRLRAGVRASDVVASIDDEFFAVLLGSILTPADATRVGTKLMKSLMEPFKVAGHDVAVATAFGVGQYPQDGAQPDALLRYAVDLAANEPALGRAGFSNFGKAGLPGAANDD